MPLSDCENGLKWGFFGNDGFLIALSLCPQSTCEAAAAQASETTATAEATTPKYETATVPDGVTTTADNSNRQN